MPRIEIDQDACKGCELCTIPCPKGLVKMSDSFNRKGYRTAAFDDDGQKCTGCAMCAMMCPDVCIIVYKER